MNKLLFAGLAAVLFTACEKTPDPITPGDSGTIDDRGRITDATTPADSGSDAGRDAGTAPDAIVFSDAAIIDGGPGDESVRGTPLEGIRFEWPERLELCSEWREGRPAADERADQAKLILARGSRPSLGSGDLGAATLPDGLVQRGVLAADFYPIASAAVSTALTRYDLDKQPNVARLNVELEHDLGAAGLLNETIIVARTTGDTRPVVVGGFEYEHLFALLRPGASEPVRMETCGGRPELEQILQVLTASDGIRSVTLTRQARSIETEAGSYPLHFQAATLAFSDRPYQVDFAGGFFSHVYAAQHHNFDESTILDFRRDVGFYQTIYGPYLAGMTPVPEATIEARLFGIGGFSSSMGIEVDTLELDTGNLRTETFTVTDRWARVDHAALLRIAEQTCFSGAAVRSVGYSEYIFQLLTCPSAGPAGFDLIGLVPVTFQHEMAQVGKLVDQPRIEAVVVDQRPGFRATVGDSRVTISKSNTAWFGSVVDRDGVEQASFASDEALGPFELTRWEERLAAESDDKTVSMQLDRLWAGQGVGESSIFAPTRFELTFGATKVVVEAFDRLSYVNTHHNWLDQLVAKGDGLTITWEVRFVEAPRSYFVRVVRDADGVELLPETELERL